MIRGYLFWKFSQRDEKKIAYAASWIKDIGDKEKKYLQSNLNNFVAVSVREKSVADKLRSISISAEVVLDPIFLLPLNYWQEKFKLVKTPLKHIVLYNIQHSQNAYKLAHFMAHILWSQVIEITGDIILFNFKKWIQDNAGPHDFLQLIYTSEFVVSTSFHGVAFAILFEKQFFSLGMKDNEDRVKDLLTMLWLKERYLWEKDDIYKVYRKPKIDYTLVRKKLNIMRKKSEDFLLKSLSS